MEREFLGVWIPKHIYLHKGLTPTEKLLMAEIESFSKNGVCFASNEHFAEFFDVTKNHISKMLTKFKKMGLIRIDLVYKTGTKIVEKRLIYPIRTNADTPNHLGITPLRINEYTPNHLGIRPLIIDDYYKEQDKYSIKEQDKEQKDLKNIRSNSSEFESKLIEERALPKNGTPSKKLSSSQLESEFDQIWAIYPKKIGKKKAFDSFKKARNDKKISYEDIENGLYKYVKHLQTEETEAQYIMHGSTWFNQEKWQDEYITHAPKRKPRNMTEYVKQKYGGAITHESRRNGEVTDYSETPLSELWQ